MDMFNAVMRSVCRHVTRLFISNSASEISICTRISSGTTQGWKILPEILGAGNVDY